MSYGTKYAESEAFMAALTNDPADLDTRLSDMLPHARRALAAAAERLLDALDATAEAEETAETDKARQEATEADHVMIARTFGLPRCFLGVDAEPCTPAEPCCTDMPARCLIREPWTPPSAPNTPRRL